jgi:hypothetical protein
MSSYFSVGEKVNISQTDVEIRVENGEVFGQNQVIGVYIPPSVKFFDGTKTTLNFDVLIKNTNAFKTALTLDGLIGANSLFSRVVCYAGNRTQVLETTENYNSWVSVKFAYDKSDSIMQKRSLTEGCGQWTPASRGTLGTSKSIQNNAMYNPYMKMKNLAQDPTTTIAAADEFVKCSVSLQIHMGLFAQNEVAVPNVALDGIYIEFLCEENSRVIKNLDGVSNNRRVALNAMYGSGNGNGAQIANTDTIAQLHTLKLNNQQDPQHSAFQVGEIVELVNVATGVKANYTNELKIATIENGTATEPIKYTFDQTAPPVAAENITAGTEAAPTFVLVSKPPSDFSPSYEISNCRLIVRQLHIAGFEEGMMAKMNRGGKIMYDLNSVATILHSTSKNDLVSTLQIPLEHAKCRSILVMSTDNEKIYTLTEQMDGADLAAGGTPHNPNSQTYIYTKMETNYSNTTNGYGFSNRSTRTGLSGIGDKLDNYNFIIDSVKVPAREIHTEKSSSVDKAFNGDHMIELESALNQSHGVPCRSLMNHKSDFLIGRALTIDKNTIYDGRGRDVRLVLRYGTGQEKNKLHKIFVSHIKTLVIEGSNIVVEQ